jgi:hypothetical protein
VSAKSPMVPPLDVVIRNCEARRQMCANVYSYLAEGEIAANKAEKLLARGCGARDMGSCEYLGAYYLSRSEKQKAWTPLAKACFVNRNTACHRLRDERLAVPPVMTVRPQYGPSWPSDFIAADAVLVERQAEFRTCYEAMRPQSGFVEMQISIKAGDPSAEILNSTLDHDFGKCLVRRIESVLFRKTENRSLQRTFQYFRSYIE